MHDPMNPTNEIDRLARLLDETLGTDLLQDAVIETTADCNACHITVAGAALRDRVIASLSALDDAAWDRVAWVQRDVARSEGMLPTPRPRSIASRGRWSR